MKKLRSISLGLTIAACSVPYAMAQSTTAGDITGVVSDPTGAVIPNATVTITNTGTGETKIVRSSGTGLFRVSLLSPGSYTVAVTAAGFGTTTSTVTVSAGSVSNDDTRLTLGQGGNTTVEVSGSLPPINTTNGDVTTTFTAEEVQALPNPGNDLTFVAQTAPGSVMNTGTAAGGYGNFSSFGVSGLSNMFTLDGGYENDPFLNLNNTGASNLTLGNNEVDTVTVVSPAFSSQFGGLGGAQVNEITQGGTNRVHGNASYYWDGRVLNSNDWFNKQNEAFSGQQNIPQFVNANQYAASIGGPIYRDKLFFFVNTEGIRAVTPQQGQVNVPNQLFQNCSLGRDPGGVVAVGGVATSYASCATLNGIADNGTLNGTNQAGVGLLGDGIPFTAAAANQQALLTRIFNTYNTSPYRPTAANAVTQNPNDPTSLTYYAHSAQILTEYLITARVDWKISDKDAFYIHYKQDHGTQPTYTDLISPLFTVQSPQPAWEGQINETHSFSPNFTNQLVLTGNYYSAPFQNSNDPTAVANVAPYTLEFVSGSFTTYGGENYAFPQGRRVAGYQIIDDLSYTKGRDTLRFGYNFRRDNITDIQGEETTSPVALSTVENFAAGLIDYEYIQRFPVRPTQPVSVYNEGTYVENVYKVRPNFTLTTGLRLERDSNPTCHTDCFQVLSTGVYNLPTGATSQSTPYSNAAGGGLINAGRYRAFTEYQKLAVMPRVSFNYSPSSKTVVRGGFGMFVDTFPGIIADDILSNPPTNFHAVLYGSTSGAGTNNFNMDSSTTGSAYASAVASNSAFQNGYRTGQNYTQVNTAVNAATGGAFSTPSFTTPSARISYPTYEEYSFAVEQQINRRTSVSATYVGNHGYHEPVVDGTRNLSSSKASANFFPTLPTAKPVTPFSTITNVYSGASSNFNGVVLGAQRTGGGLTLKFNYEYSKALDEISNGGFEPYAPDNGDASSVANPANLHAQYGLADYNVKHNTTASFVYNIPAYHRFKAITGGFQFSGNVFHQTGLPYTVTQSTTSGLPSSLANGGVNLFARQLNNNFDHHCGGSAHVLLPDDTAPNPCNFVSSFGAPTNFTQQGRNSLIGPSYTNVDFGAFKEIPLPRYETVKLKLGAQFFNLFNHPNFQNPSHTLTSNNSTLGSISSTVGAPTSILGSTGGADASPRLIQLHGTITF